MRHLVREAKRYDRNLTKRTPAAFSDLTYFVPASDALAGAAAVLGRSRKSTIASVTETSVSDDWTYTEVIDVDRDGEFLNQGRSRSLVRIERHGGEVAVFGSSVAGKRQLRPDDEPSAWIDQDSELNLKAIRKVLSKLEKQHLASVRATDATAALDDFEQVLPEGFDVVSSTETSLKAQRITRRTQTVRGDSASWHVRTSLTAVVEDAEGTLAVGTRTEHRISTSASEGPWQPATSVDGAMALDWLVDALRVGMPQGHMQFGQTLREPVKVEGELSEPPPPPKLRTMAEIERIVTSRALQTATGKFTVCLEQIDVDRVNSTGQAWDMALGGSPGPDLAGTIVIGGRTFTIPAADNTFQVMPAFCETSDYKSGSPYAQVDLWDVDISSHDPVASCPIDLHTMALQGADGIPCMSARLSMNVKYNFSFGQIKAVGLPPADSGKRGDVLEGVAMENLAVARQPIHVYVLILNPRELARREVGGPKVVLAKLAEGLGFYSNLASMVGAEGNSLLESVYVRSAQQARDQFATEGVRAAVSVVNLQLGPNVDSHLWSGSAKQQTAVPPGQYPLLKITISDPLRAAASQGGVLAKLGGVLAPSVLQELVRNGVEQRVTEAMRAQGGEVLIVDR